MSYPSQSGRETLGLRQALRQAHPKADEFSGDARSLRPGDGLRLSESSSLPASIGKPAQVSSHTVSVSSRIGGHATCRYETSMIRAAKQGPQSKHRPRHRSGGSEMGASDAKVKTTVFAPSDHLRSLRYFQD
jgi:hypothetical protein